jgi:hypothetical protein
MVVIVAKLAERFLNGLFSGRSAAASQTGDHYSPRLAKEPPMKQSVILTVASMLMILLSSLHLADDIARGIEKGGPSDLVVVPMMVLLVYGTLVLAGRRSGYVIILLGSLLGAYVPVLHFKGAGGVAGRIANSSGAFFFVWTLLALGVCAVFSGILSAHGLWKLQRGRSRESEIESR